jgi:hypothetical protein
LQGPHLSTHFAMPSMTLLGATGSECAKVVQLILATLRQLRDML